MWNISEDIVNFCKIQLEKELNHISMITFLAANTIEAKCIICDVG